MPYPRDLHPIPGNPGRFELRVDQNHPAFEGHFPGDPILSGLIQVDWAIRLGRETFGFPGTFRSLEHVKFQAPIRPEESMELRLSWDASRGCLDFLYWGREGRKSHGIAVFTTAP